MSNEEKDTKNGFTRKKWTEEEMKIFKDYIKKEGQALKEIFYKNIYKGEHIHKKENGFFASMGRQLKRSTPKCKSKFQKEEANIYHEVLDIPKEHYEVFQNLPKKKSKEKRNRLKGEPLLSKVQIDDLRKKIIQCIDAHRYNFDKLKGILILSSNLKKLLLKIKIINQIVIQTKKKIKIKLKIKVKVKMKILLIVII